MHVEEGDVAAPGLSVEFGKPWRMVFWRDQKLVLWMSKAIDRRTTVSVTAV